VLRAIIEQVTAAPLQQWLLEQLPGFQRGSVPGR
jgi:hypothetical protein